MMNITEYPPKQFWPALLQRPQDNEKDINSSVAEILTSVKKEGDKAIKTYSFRFDNYALEQLAVPEEMLKKADSISNDLKDAIGNAISNIRTFHQNQKEAVKTITTMPGIDCWRKPVAIERIGLYVPGGTAPLFSTVLMLGIPAQLAGCKETILCTPPDASGNIDPAILYAAIQTGIRRIYRVGGAQAIAAMAYGTESIPKVSKIFGPGNRYVTQAKKMVQMEGVAIDMPAGPSELAILADDTCKPSYIAADLLSQAEHGPDSQVLLVSDNPGIIREVQDEIRKALQTLPREATARKALQHSKAILVSSLSEGMELINEYAPEHLIIACANDEEWGEKVINAGSVFLGNYSPESAGDYASGTNHTLPTNGHAKAYSGVSVDSFCRKITFQKLTKKGLAGIAKTIITMADAEGLQAHANSIQVRLLS